MKVAFVQDWFNANGGAEKVAGAILEMYDHEDLSVYALFNKFPEDARSSILHNRPVHVSVLQYIPFISRLYRYFIPVMPWLMGRFHLRGYDLILSTSHAVAKGFRADPGTLSICYCHTPLRPIWDMYDDYAISHPMGGSFFYRAFVRYLRRWDVASAARVHFFIANSQHIRQRILKSYGREAEVIYPPVRVDKFKLNEQSRKDYYLCTGRVVPYKKMDMVIRAFQQMPERRLIVVGDGWGATEFPDLIRNHSNIEWFGYRNDEELVSLIGEAKACIFAAKEDFGIMCVEAQACGTPVLALDYGGYRETVVNGISGYLFPDQTVQGVEEAVNRFEQSPLTDHKAIRSNAERFSTEQFKTQFQQFVQSKMTQFYP